MKEESKFVEKKENNSHNFDKRNKLNNLGAKEWIIGTKSVFYYNDDLKKDIPVNIRYIRKLIRFFTKKGNIDDGGGSGVLWDEETLEVYVWGWRTKLRVQTTGSGNISVFIEGPGGFDGSQSLNTDRVYELSQPGYYYITAWIFSGNGSVTVTASGWMIV
jgi:hypothetical protein